MNEIARGMALTGQMTGVRVFKMLCCVVLCRAVGFCIEHKEPST